MHRLTFAATALTAALTLPAAAQETRPFTDDLDRTVEISVDPRGIVGPWDWDITTALNELGAPVVASEGTPSTTSTRDDPAPGAR